MGGDKDLNQEAYVLKSVTEHKVIINDFEPSNTGTRSHLEQMISYALRSFIDNNFHVFDGSVEALADAGTFNDGATAIVKNAIWIHDQPFSELFPGFSEVLKDELNGIEEIEGYRIKLEDVDAPARDGIIGLYTFQKMVYQLKQQAELEVSVFLDQYLPVSNRRGYDESDTAPLLSYEDYTLNSENNTARELAELIPDPDLFGNGKPGNKKSNRKGNDYSERIVELLEENNRILANYSFRFENLQDQINELKKPRPEVNNEIKTEIAELREMIRELASGGEIRESDGSRTKIAPEETITVVFEKNEFELSLAQKAKLNKAYAVLQKNRDYTALITGYADKTGDPDFNAWISKQRANSVKNYLQQMGVDQRRLLVNFLGDVESESANPEDRKVSIQYISNYSAKN